MPTMQQNRPFYNDATCNSVVKIITYDRHGIEINRASTGFLVKAEAENFLITNYHVVPGVSPDRRFREGAPPPPPHTIELWNFGVPVAEANGERLIYKVHPDFQTLRCDIVAIPISQFRPSPKATPHAGGFLFKKRVSGLNFIPALRQENASSDHKFVDDMFLPIGRDVTVFGFPGGLEQNAYPIGINTKIASDAYQGPVVLISGGTYKGCSGGPAVARSIAGYQAFQPEEANRICTKYTVRTYTGNASVIDHIIGVYAGRKVPDASFDEYADANDNAIQVGVVWKFEEVLRTMSDGTYEAAE